MSASRSAVRTLLAVCLAAVLMASVMVGVGFAEGYPASKAACQVSDVTILDETDASLDWKPILKTRIKTSSQKDLFVDANLECGLFTSTLARSKDMVSDTSNSTAGIKVRVLVDGAPAYPGEVVFARRSQTLTAKLQGQITTVDTDGDGILEPGEIESVAPEEIELILDSMDANSFEFVLTEVGTGVHDVVVEAAIDLSTSAQQGKASAKALIGKGCVTVEEVRMVKSADITF